ncbi:MAG: GNAT family N-acetyltransferase [Cyanobacteria bacterium P01_H01_bin.121]
MNTTYREFLIRDWQPSDRQAAATVIQHVLAEYGLGWEPEATDQDVIAVETHYWKTNGQFWVVEHNGNVVGTAGFYPIDRSPQAVELRKMYLLPTARGQGLGRYLLQQLEQAIAAQGFQSIWIETAAVLQTAVKLYERNGYQPADGEIACRCDRLYMKELV